jgi:hypothetical protein
VIVFSNDGSCGVRRSPLSFMLAWTLRATPTGRRWSIHWLSGASRRSNQRRQRMALTTSKPVDGPPLISGPS